MGTFFAVDFFPAFTPGALPFEAGRLLLVFNPDNFFAGTAFFTGVVFDRAVDFAGLRTFCAALVPVDPETFLVPGIRVLRTGRSGLLIPPGNHPL